MNFISEPRIRVNTGVATTTFQFDNNGNVLQKNTNGLITSYQWDYANRLIALGVSGASTTYAYGPFGERVLQTTATTTFIYPNKFYSVASSTGSGAKYATTTEYIFNGDALVSTVDQQFASGVATGTAQKRYVHADHLGSTNIVSDESGNIVTGKDYYPYGSVRVNSGSASLARGYIGQFTDDSTLSYLLARYYDSGRGQFMSQDPVFWEIGLSQDGKIALSNPQALNSYGYANDNPITGKDPNGRQCVGCVGREGAYSLLAQRAFDTATGHVTSPEEYSGVLSASTVYGFAYPATLVAPVPIAAISGWWGNMSQQMGEIANGKRTSFDLSGANYGGTLAAGVQLTVGNAPIPFVSNSLAKQIETKLERGTIRNVKDATLDKIMRSEAPSSIIGNFAQNYAQSYTGGRLPSIPNVSFASPSQSAVIQLAQATIQLARSVISSYKAR